MSYAVLCLKKTELVRVDGAHRGRLAPPAARAAAARSPHARRVLVWFTVAAAAAVRPGAARAGGARDRGVLIRRALARAADPARGRRYCGGAAAGFRRAAGALWAAARRQAAIVRGTDG